MTVTATTFAFRPITLEDGAWLAPLMRTGSPNCEQSFTTLFMWRSHYNTTVCRMGGAALFRSGENGFRVPLGGDLRQNLRLLRNISDGPLHMYVTSPGELERLLAAGNFEVTPLPDAFDYVYEREALSTLAGKVFHGKRGHIAAFSAKYAWEYERIDDANTPEVLQAAAQWCSEHGCCQDDSLTAENCAIVEAMMNRDALNIKGGLLRVDGKVIAFTFASPITDEVADIHVEKALSDYADAYAVINREFAARELSAYRYINRENDLGVEGLRKAKRSYHPAFMVEKYLCVEK